VKKKHCCQRTSFLCLLPQNGAFSLWSRNGKGFCERTFALHRQYPESEKDKQCFCFYLRTVNRMPREYHKATRIPQNATKSNATKSTKCQNPQNANATKSTKCKKTQNATKSTKCHEIECHDKRIPQNATKSNATRIPQKWLVNSQARNQIGTLGVAKSSLTGAQFF